MFVPKEKITVITGRLSKSEFEQQEIISKVAEVIIHPDYTHPSLLNNDIALLVLVEPVPFNKNIEISDVPVLQFPVFGRSRSSPFRSLNGPVFFASVFGLFSVFLMTINQ